MFKEIIVLVLAASCVSGLAFTDCGSTATVHALRIQGCTAQPCIFRRGQTYIIEMDVTSRSNSNALPLTITGHPPIIPPITVFSGNACTMLTAGSCPSAPGNFKTARIPYTVGNLLPAISLPVRFTVRDDSGATPVCGQIQVQIQG
ncbi:NPC intracellular cholesterol transporter 2-like [Bradysia coprophila]|uniref:NPC intracellular cholesterol transporter 2-like n=1 Tax=Bradysia coprophila TaxID=38358 RepID=UPI00187DADBD|nr:NPC intracellular cholesterol transporter 2-like [Bradysia coprophila]